MIQVTSEMFIIPRTISFCVNVPIEIGKQLVVSLNFDVSGQKKADKL